MQRTDTCLVDFPMIFPRLRPDYDQSNSVTRCKHQSQHKHVYPTCWSCRQRGHHPPCSSSTNLTAFAPHTWSNPSSHPTHLMTVHACKPSQDMTVSLFGPPTPRQAIAFSGTLPQLVQHRQRTGVLVLRCLRASWLGRCALSWCGPAQKPVPGSLYHRLVMQRWVAWLLQATTRHHCRA